MASRPAPKKPIEDFRKPWRSSRRNIGRRSEDAFASCEAEIVGAQTGVSVPLKAILAHHYSDRMNRAVVFQRDVGGAGDDFAVYFG